LRCEREQHKDATDTKLGELLSPDVGDTGEPGSAVAGTDPKLQQALREPVQSLSSRSIIEAEEVALLDDGSADAQASRAFSLAHRGNRKELKGGRPSPAANALLVLKNPTR
jgi:hypothetical protein